MTNLNLARRAGYRTSRIFTLTVERMARISTRLDRAGIEHSCCKVEGGHVINIAA